jgi:hypothetical protein
MKDFLRICALVVIGSATTLIAQNTAQVNTQPMGRGRGGAPYAWNDKNKNGICDITGAAVGQGRAAAGPRCGRRGRGVGAGWGRGNGARVQASATIPGTGGHAEEVA